MIKQTRKFPTISTITSMESTVVMATPAVSDMIAGCQCQLGDLDKNNNKNILISLLNHICNNESTG